MFVDPNALSLAARTSRPSLETCWCHWLWIPSIQRWGWVVLLTDAHLDETTHNIHRVDGGKCWALTHQKRSAKRFYILYVCCFPFSLVQPCSTCSQVTGRKSDSTAPRWWMGGHLPHSGINISMICWELLRLNVHCAFRKQNLSKVCASYPRIVLRQQAELQAHAEPGHGTQTCCPWIIRHQAESI